MNPRLRVVRTIAELKADGARDRLLAVLDNLHLTEGQRKRLRTLIAAYGCAQREAGESRAESIPKEDGIA